MRVFVGSCALLLGIAITQAQQATSPPATSAATRPADAMRIQLFAPGGPWKYDGLTDLPLLLDFGSLGAGRRELSVFSWTTTSRPAGDPRDAFTEAVNSADNDMGLDGKPDAFVELRVDVTPLPPTPWTSRFCNTDGPLYPAHVESLVAPGRLIYRLAVPCGMLMRASAVRIRAIVHAANGERAESQPIDLPIVD